MCSPREVHPWNSGWWQLYGARPLLLFHGYCIFPLPWLSREILLTFNSLLANVLMDNSFVASMPGRCNYCSIKCSVMIAQTHLCQDSWCLVTKKSESTPVSCQNHQSCWGSCWQQNLLTQCLSELLDKELLWFPFALFLWPLRHNIQAGSVRTEQTDIPRNRLQPLMGLTPYKGIYATSESYHQTWQREHSPYSLFLYPCTGSHLHVMHNELTML